MFGKKNISKMIFSVSSSTPPLISGACSPIQNAGQVKKEVNKKWGSGFRAGPSFLTTAIFLLIRRAYAI